MYMYNFKNPIIKKYGDRFYVTEMKKIYLFIPTQNLSEYILSKLQADNSYEKCIKNRYNLYITEYLNHNYILIYVSRDNSISIKALLSPICIMGKSPNKWDALWQIKTDRIKAKLKYIDNDMVNESKYYYLGLAENAILFYKYNQKNMVQNQSFLCRIRINENDYKLPTNVCIDSKERNFAEYIKYLFYKNPNDITKITTFLSCISKENKYLIFCRLLFPTEYFDEIESLITDNTMNENKVKVIIANIVNYENLLNYLYYQFFHEENEILWLKKN